MSCRSGPGTVRVALTLRRIAVRARALPRPWSLPLAAVSSAAYRGWALVVVGMDVPTRTRIGTGLVVHHGVGLVVQADVVIGRDVVLRQSTTIGTLGEGGAAPVLEDGVEVGANVVIVGAVRIGAGARIGAGSVVVRDVSPHAVVVGNPARVLGEQ